MVSPAFYLILFLVALVIGAIVALLLRGRLAAGPSEGEVPVDRRPWSVLASRGAEALKAYGRSGSRGPCILRDVGAPETPGAPGGGRLREVDLDPATLVGRTAAGVLADLGAPDRTAPGEAWLSSSDGAHYVLRPGGGIVKLHVFGAVPSRIPVGVPYLRWSWDGLMRPGSPGDRMTWALCLTAPADSGELVVAEVLTHPTGARF